MYNNNNDDNNNDNNHHHHTKSHGVWARRVREGRPDDDRPSDREDNNMVCCSCVSFVVVYVL